MNDDWFEKPPLPAECALAWWWCPTCKCRTLLCPLCNNNGCNGGRGEVNGEKCPLCPMMWELERVLYTAEVRARPPL